MKKYKQKCGKTVGCYLAIFALLLMNCACDSDDNITPTDYKALEIMTLINTPDGLDFELQRSEDSEIIRIETDQQLADTTLVDGTRMLVYYKTQLCDTSLRPMPARILQLGYVAFDTVRAKSINEIAMLPPSQLEVISRWRTGKYLNLRSEIEYDGNSRSFSIVADQSTLNNSQIDCYIYNTGSPVSENSIDRRAYGSFFLGDLWDMPQLQRIRVYTNGVSDKSSYFDIDKNSNTPKEFGQLATFD